MKFNTLFPLISLFVLLNLMSTYLAEPLTEQQYVAHGCKSCIEKAKPKCNCPKETECVLMERNCKECMRYVCRKMETSPDEPAAENETTSQSNEASPTNSINYGTELSNGYNTDNGNDNGGVLPTVTSACPTAITQNSTITVDETNVNTYTSVIQHYFTAMKPTTSTIPTFFKSNVIVDKYKTVSVVLPTAYSTVVYTSVENVSMTNAIEETSILFTTTCTTVYSTNVVIQTSEGVQYSTCTTMNTVYATVGMEVSAIIPTGETIANETATPTEIVSIAVPTADVAGIGKDARNGPKYGYGKQHRKDNRRMYGKKMSKPIYS